MSSKPSTHFPIAPLQRVVASPITDSATLKAINELRRQQNAAGTPGAQTREEASAALEELTAMLSAEELLALGERLLDRLSHDQLRQLQQRLSEKLGGA
jgi:hypothetical protein